MSESRIEGDRAALDRLLGIPEMAWLLERVRARIPDARVAVLTGVVRLQKPSPQQRAAAVRLVGRPRRSGAALVVDLADVEAVLRRGPWPPGLGDAVETLTGPVVDRRALRERDAEAWARAGADLAHACAPFEGLYEWWLDWCAAGGLKRAARAEAVRTDVEVSPQVATGLVRSLTAMLAALPAEGEPLAVLARRVVGDAHGLDETRPLGRLGATVAATAFGAGETGSTREAWAAAGVLMSNVASTVLCLGVPGRTPEDASGAPMRTATAVALEAMRSARSPLVLTLDQVRSGGVRPLPDDACVHVCENPTVIEVAATSWAETDQADGAMPVLVCTWGQPSTAVVELLAVLVSDGAQCRYHGDFDWAGLRIARALRARVSWAPWRYRAEDYRAAVADDVPALRLRGAPAESPWDPDLAAVMAESGIAVEEEAVAALLAADLLR